MSFITAAALGTMSGMRSMSGPLLMSYRAVRRPLALKGTPFGWLGYPQVLTLFSLMEVGEVIADKTPLLPNRIEPGPLLGRAHLGAFAGAAAFTEADDSPVIGAVVSAITAVASSFIFYYLRRGVVRRIGLPDPVIAFAEDALVVGIGLLVLGTEGGQKSAADPIR